MMPQPHPRTPSIRECHAAYPFLGAIRGSFRHGCNPLGCGVHHPGALADEPSDRQNLGDTINAHCATPPNVYRAAVGNLTDWRMKTLITVT